MISSPSIPRFPHRFFLIKFKKSLHVYEFPFHILNFELSPTFLFPKTNDRKFSHFKPPKPIQFIINLFNLIFHSDFSYFPLLISIYFSYFFLNKKYESWRRGSPWCLVLFSVFNKHSEPLPSPPQAWGQYPYPALPNLGSTHLSVFGLTQPQTKLSLTFLSTGGWDMNV